MNITKYVPVKCSRRDFGIQAATELLIPIVCFTTDGVILSVRGWETERHLLVEAFKERVLELREDKQQRWTLSQLTERERVRGEHIAAARQREKERNDRPLEPWERNISSHR